QGLTSPATRVSVGNQRACAIVATGAVQCWGVVGPGIMNTNSSTAIAVPGLSSGVTALSVGGQFPKYSECAITSTGGVVCEGANDDGQLGNGSAVADSASPVPVTRLASGAIDVSVGGNTACAVTLNGDIECWGSNNVGQLGNGSTDPRSGVPTHVSGF